MSSGTHFNNEPLWFGSIGHVQAKTGANDEPLWFGSIGHVQAKAQNMEKAEGSANGRSYHHPVTDLPTLPQEMKKLVFVPVSDQPPIDRLVPGKILPLSGEGQSKTPSDSLFTVLSANTETYSKSLEKGYLNQFSQPELINMAHSAVDKLSKLQKNEAVSFTVPEYHLLTDIFKRSTHKKELEAEPTYQNGYKFLINGLIDRLQSYRSEQATSLLKRLEKIDPKIEGTKVKRDVWIDHKINSIPHSKKREIIEGIKNKNPADFTDVEAAIVLKAMKSMKSELLSIQHDPNLTFNLIMSGLDKLL